MSRRFCLFANCIDISPRNFIRSSSRSLLLLLSRPACTQTNSGRLNQQSRRRESCVFFRKQNARDIQGGSQRGLRRSCLRFLNSSVFSSFFPGLRRVLSSFFFSTASTSLAHRPPFFLLLHRASSLFSVLFSGFFLLHPSGLSSLLSLSLFSISGSVFAVV